MRKLISRPIDDGVEVVYELSAAEREAVGATGSKAEHFTYHFSRIALGVAFDDGLWGVVVGERTWWGDRHRVARAYLVLDEVEGDSPAPFFADIVRLKDEYLPKTLFCPDRPQQMVESLRRMEGLTHYYQTMPAANRDLWPSFVSTSTVVGVNESKKPPESAVLRDLEAFLTAPVLDPVTSEPFRVGVVGPPLTQLSLPEELNNRTFRTAVRQGLSEPLVALWYAVTGLDSTRPRRHRRRLPSAFAAERHGNTITGY